MPSWHLSNGSSEPFPHVQAVQLAVATQVQVQIPGKSKKKTKKQKIVFEFCTEKLGKF